MRREGERVDSPSLRTRPLLVIHTGPTEEEAGPFLPPSRLPLSRSQPFTPLIALSLQVRAAVDDILECLAIVSAKVSGG